VGHLSNCILATFFCCVVPFSAKCQARISIISPSDLKMICVFPDSNFQLENDIIIEPNDPWIPCEFHGSLYGNDNTIFGLKLSDSAGGNIGFFTRISPSAKSNCTAPLWTSSRWLDSCIIRNDIRPEVIGLKFSDASVSGSGTSAVLAGVAQYSRLERIELEGHVSGKNGVGVLVGSAGPFVDIVQCKARGSVKGANQVGGLVGSLFFSQIGESQSELEIKGVNHVGGIVGRASSSVIHTVANRSLISANDSVGGIVGSFYGSNQGKVHAFRNGCHEIQSDILSMFRMDDYAWSYKGDRDVVDGQIFRYRGYSSRNEPDGSLPYFHFLYGKNGDSRFNEKFKSRFFNWYDSRCPRLVSGLSIESRMFEAYSGGEIECKKVCGGVVGANVNDVVSFSHLIHSGLIAGGTQTGQFFGSGSSVDRLIDLIASGIVLGTRGSWQFFGTTPQKIGWALQLSPPPLSQSFPYFKMLGISSPKEISQGADGVTWSSGFYPSGFYLPRIGIDSTFRMSKFPTRSQIKPPGFQFTSDWRIKKYENFDSIIPQAPSEQHYWKMRYSKFPRLLPPIPTGGIPDVPLGGCVDLRQRFHSEAPDLMEFSIKSDSRIWTLEQSVLCKTMIRHASPALVRIRNRGESKQGQTWIQVFAKNGEDQFRTKEQ